MDKKQLIENSLIQLMEEQRFREITIKMLCNKAGINRSTFYAYFEDKYALLDSMIDSHISHLESILNNDLQDLHLQKDKKSSIEKYLEHIFQYIYEHRQFFRVLLTLHPAQNFTQKLLSNWRNNYMHVLETTASLEYPDYFISYTLGGQFGVLYFWLQNDCPEPPEVISKVIHNNIMKINR